MTGPSPRRDNASATKTPDNVVDEESLTGDYRDKEGDWKVLRRLIVSACRMNPR